GRLGTPPVRHYDLAARSSLQAVPEEMPETEAHPCPKTPRWSAERCASLRRGTQGASQAPGLPRQRRGDARLEASSPRRAFDAAGRTGARNTRASSRRSAPLGYRGRTHGQKLGRIAPRERDALFDIVRRIPLSSPRKRGSSIPEAVVSGTMGPRFRGGDKRR